MSFEQKEKRVLLLQKQELLVQADVQILSLFEPFTLKLIIVVGKLLSKIFLPICPLARDIELIFEFFVTRENISYTIDFG
jgi:hypothetical protein